MLTKKQLVEILENYPDDYLIMVRDIETGFRTDLSDIINLGRVNGKPVIVIDEHDYA